ncbi:hypothetical protein GYMLUDRAFT_34878 [Collybiopsis luxurians FD-317 M1]|nr:hypothetical protein GYMLUDRAFT_34878 [Collybiopsis luxurians FD-317 M1]
MPKVNKTHSANAKPSYVSPEGKEYWVIQKVVAVKEYIDLVDQRQEAYLVKWEGWDASWDCWIPPSAFLVPNLNVHPEDSSFNSSQNALDEGDSSKVYTEKDRERSRLQIGAVVLAKTKGHAPWPGRIINPVQVPLEVQGMFCVQLFPRGNFAWLEATEISVLTTADIDTLIRSISKKSPRMRAFKIARDPREWSVEYDMRVLNETCIDSELFQALI